MCEGSNSSTISLTHVILKKEKHNNNSHYNMWDLSLSSTILEVLASAVKQDKKMKDIQKERKT